MLEKTLLTPASTPAQTPQKRVLRMGGNDRTAGSMPVWENPKTAAQQVEQQLTLAAIQPGSKTFSETLAYTYEGGPAEADEEFGFADIIDMVNPLQHIPLVSHVYREITGDEIKPISKIIGGGVFGGPAGAAVGLVDAAVTAETGEDIAGNAMNLALHSEMPSRKAKQPLAIDHPEQRLESAQNGYYEDLPASLLAFTDNGYRQQNMSEEFTGAERLSGIEARMGKKLPREPVTQMKIAAQMQTRRYND